MLTIDYKHSRSEIHTSSLADFKSIDLLVDQWTDYPERAEV